MSFPQWLRTSQATATGVWDSRAESEELLASRSAMQLQAYDRLLGGSEQWRIRFEQSSETIASTPDALAPVLTEHVFRDAEGAPFPARGYELTLVKEGVAGHIAIDLRVGVSRPGRRAPANRCVVTILGPKREDGERLSIDSTLAEGVLQGMVAAWDPDSAAVRDRDGAQASAGRGHFAPLAGQRSWVSSRVGEIAGSTSRVTVTAAEGGAYLFADDDLDSASAIQEMLATFDANDAQSIPAG